MSQTTAWLEALDGTNAVAATIRYSLHGFAREAQAADAARVAFEDTDPVRAPSSYPHRKSFEGRLWLASTRQHVLFESFWERAFLANLDRTQSAERVASQPMWIDWSTPGRSHAPDFFVRRTDGSALLVDVHPKDDTDADDEAKFELTRRLSGALGSSATRTKQWSMQRDFVVLDRRNKCSAHPRALSSWRQTVGVRASCDTRHRESSGTASDRGVTARRLPASRETSRSCQTRLR